jgi:hypothetical protein
VKIGGRHVDVESVRFVDETTGIEITANGVTTPSIEEDAIDTKRGRLFVIFVQTDFAREKSRTRGQLNFMDAAQKLIDSFEDEDRVAVFSFDSHLKFRLDFTSDKEKVKEQLRASLLIDNPPAPPIVPNPALASRLDAQEMRDAASSEKALLLIGNALRAIDGPKTMLLLGWGLGEYVAGSVRMTAEWPAAHHALDASRTSIVALDTSFADYHSLEFGLKTAAEQTGGMYAKTHEFPEIVIDRVKRTLSGHYELELRRPASLPRGSHPVVVNVKRRGTLIFAPTTYTDR